LSESHPSNLDVTVTNKPVFNARQGEELDPGRSRESGKRWRKIVWSISLDGLEVRKGYPF
jgi:hypothetical protein